MNYITTLEHLAGYLPWLGVGFLCIVVLITLIKIALRFTAWRKLSKRSMVCLELTPPAHTQRTGLATKELFTVLHGLRQRRSRKQRLLQREASISLEVTGTRETGIRYLIRLESRLAAQVQGSIHSYLPDLKIAVIEDTASFQTPAKVIEFKQSGHYAFPLVDHAFLDEHDPAAFLTGAMTMLEPGEAMNVQIVMSPVKITEAMSLSRKILSNEDMLTKLSGHRQTFLPKIAYGLNTVLFGILDAIGTLSSGATRSTSNYDFRYTSQRKAYENLQVAKRQKPARSVSTFEEQLLSDMHDKLRQPLFRVYIRASFDLHTQAETKARIGAIKSALESYSTPSYQELEQKMSLPLMSRYRAYLFRKRLPGILERTGAVLSASELAGLYHFPTGKLNRTDNVVTSLSRTLTAPISMKGTSEYEIVIGENHHHGQVTPIGLTAKDRERHVYIIGGTGNGKTTMLQSGLVQDMQAGRGIAVIDPHGDMAETLLKYVPKERMKDVVYFNPDDITFPIGLNLLELTPGLEGDELLREKDIVTEALVSVFRKIFSEDDSGGHRIEYVLRNTIQTALTLENATLFTVYDLINDKKFRTKVLANLKNKDLKNFWDNELGKAGEMQKVKMAAGITAKIGRFLFSASAKRILEQPKSTINFEEIINDGKILICNFSKGLLGEDTSELFGITVLAKLQLASLRRARIGQGERVPFYLYVDEFQNFANMSFVQMLSESRKYKLFLTMAEQSTSQQDDQQMVNVILANVGTVICFRTGNPQDEKLLLPLFSPDIEEGDISNLSSYNFYAKLAAVVAQEPLSGRTMLLPDEGDNVIAHAVIELSRAQYAIKRSAPAEQLRNDLNQDEDDDEPSIEIMDGVAS